MAYDEKLAQRIRGILAGKKKITEKKMFGGLSFLSDGKMVCGIIYQTDLVVRTGPEKYEKFLKEKHVRPMNFTGKPLKGFLFVSEDGYKTDASLKKWIDAGLEFVASLPSKGKNYRK